MDEFLSKVRFTLCDISRFRNILQAPEFFLAVYAQMSGSEIKTPRWTSVWSRFGRF